MANLQTSKIRRRKRISHTGVQKPPADVSGKASLGSSAAPRGYRNKNPGNIRKQAKWQGIIGSDGSFAVFDSFESGVAAVAKQLRRYQTKFGDRSIRDIIYRYAPPHENNTNRYVTEVSKQTSVPAGAFFDTSDVTNLYAITRAIIGKEIGGKWRDAIGDEVIRRGVARALS